MDFNETVYEHDSGSPTFTITASERWSITMVNKLKAAHPDEVDIRATNSDGSVVVRMPFEWMRIKPKRKTVPMSDEQKAILVSRLAKGRDSQ